MIEIKNISINFGDLLLFRHLNLHVNRGESVCVCGDSGSGKTSLLKAVLGFVPISEGVIKVDGVEMTPRNADFVRRKIAWIPQELALPSEWVSDMVRMPFELKANRETGFSMERLLILPCWVWKKSFITSVCTRCRVDRDNGLCWRLPRYSINRY
jgi:putative ABC transport system ATP-binding protein